MTGASITRIRIILGSQGQGSNQLCLR